MNNEVVIIIISGLGLGLLFCFWFLYCNNKTYNQRIQLIENWSKGDFVVLNKEYEAIDYDTHLKALLMFRNPINLYGPNTKQLWSLR